LTQHEQISYSPAREICVAWGDILFGGHLDSIMQFQLVNHPSDLVLRVVLGMTLGLLASGCNSAMLRENEPVKSGPITAVDPNAVQFVKDFTRPWGVHSQQVQGVSLVVGLNGTGSDPGPSAERSMLLSEMQTRSVERPSEVLASRGTALAMVKGIIPPGARKGDRFDLEIRVPAGSETSSLHAGWLMQARLKEYAKLNNRLSAGHLLAHASGDVLTDDFLEGDGDKMFKTRGRILSGGIVAKERNLGLVVREEFTSVKTSAQVGRVVNQRFHMFHRGNKEGVATPKKDNFIELRIHPRYRDNIVRYLRVVQNIAVRESPAHLTERLERLRMQLSDPTAAAVAAVQLEAIGDAAVNVLEDGLGSGSPEIRFYAAEALAYLDEPAAAEELMLAVRDEPAFRWRALTALGAMEDIAAHEKLISLLNSDSAETRYGAFRMLRRLTPDDPVIRGQIVQGKLFLHTVSSEGTPLVHVAKHERPEIVLFGSEHPLYEPVVLFAGTEIVVKSNDAGGLTLRKLTSGDDDPEIKVAAQVGDMVRGIVELGGGYPEVVQAISEAKSTGALQSRLEYSAIPEAGRTYQREANETRLDKQVTAASSPARAASPRGVPPLDSIDPNPEPDFILSDREVDESLVPAELLLDRDVTFEPSTNRASAGDSIRRTTGHIEGDVRSVEFSDLVDPAKR
jgi:hypothetical protein